MATRLHIQKISPSQVQVTWATKAGFSYQLQRTQGWVTWENVGPPIIGDDTQKAVNQPAIGPRYFYRLIIDLPQGSEPPLTLYTYLNQLRVLLLWEPFGPYPTGQYQILRDNTLLAVAPADSSAYIDNTVQSGQHYVYTVKYFSA